MNSINPLLTTQFADNHTQNKINAIQQDGADFVSIFNEAMTQTLTDNVIGVQAGGSAMPFSGGSLGDLQTTLLTGAVNGQAGENEMAMFMMIMMMQEFQNSDLAPLMGALGSMLPGSAGVSAGSGTITTVGYDSIYNNVRPSRLSQPVSGFAASFLPSQAWLPTSARISSTAGKRNSAALRQVIDQFQVESSDRYQPYKNGNTYCNIFVWDVTSALGCEIPHYVDRQTGAPCAYPNTQGAYELDANGTHDWLVKNGANYGWKEVSAEEAQRYANAGYPAVTAWKNASGKAGHVQVVCPSGDGGYDTKRGVTVAQAGGKNYSYAHLTTTMSKDKIPDVRYFVHA